MIEKRVTDGSVLRLIGKWIKVGVIEDRRLLVSETGTGQGQPIRPLLANVSCITFSINGSRTKSSPG
jgi:retron-type reverse transcriptase